MDKSISAELDRQAAHKHENPELYCPWPGCLTRVSGWCDEHRPPSFCVEHEDEPKDSGKLDDFRDFYFTRDW